jgi:putative Mn2+ efflux pump MntP
MSFLEILIIAISLAMDASAASLAAGASAHVRDFRAAFRLGFHFGLFQFLMPVAGWLAGRQVAERIGAFDHWIAFALLAAVGAHMMHAGTSPPSARPLNPSRGWTLLALSLATSIDALAVGLSFAMIGIAVWLPGMVIGIVTAALSTAAALLGRRLGARLGQRMEVAGGVVLISIGLRILIAHLRG